MIYISVAEAMRLYGELVDAYHGKNGYGGDVAELYMYRFGFSAAHHHLDALAPYAAQNLRTANESLHALIEFFLLDKEPTAEAYIETQEGWRAFGEWVKKAGFDHRVHVRIERKS